MIERSILAPLSLSCILCSSLIASIPAVAQVEADGTTETNVNSLDRTNFVIDGGDRPDGGANLFHSFSEFSVPTGGSAVFNNAVDIQNIFSRVTGGNISNIDGLIQANGAANLFLINPAGIMFGRNAVLNIGGSFLGSTADSLLFQDGTEFVATDGQNEPMLTVNAPIGLSFRDEPGTIVNQSFALQVRPGATLALIGGDLSFNGGILTAPEGRLELGSVKGEGEVRFRVSQGFEMEYEEVSNFGNIQLNQQALLNVSDGGIVKIRGEQVSIQDGSQIFSINQVGTGGIVKIRGEQVSIQDGSQIFSVNQGDVEGGDIVIDAGKLLISNTARISTATLGSGAGGDVNITAAEDIEIIGTGFDQFQETFIQGILLGNIDLQMLQQGTGIIVAASGTGQAGNVTIDTSSSLRMSDGSLILSTTSSNSSEGMGGDILIDASESIELNGSALLNGSLLDSTATGGNTIVTAKNLAIRDGGLIVNATFGSGNGGDIEVDVAETVELSNTPIQAFVPTGILANSSAGTGQAGNVRISASNLLVERGAVINNNSGALLLNQPSPGEILPVIGGNAGNIEIDVSNLTELTGIGPNGIITSGISSTAFGGTSSAGDIVIDTGKLLISNEARISTATLGSGAGGDVNITAAEDIEIIGTGFDQFQETFIQGLLENTDPQALQQGTGIIVATSGTGQAGNVAIDTSSSLRMSEGALILSATSTNGNGGDILIDASESIELNGSALLNGSLLDSTATGGNTIVTAKNLAIRDGGLIVNATFGSGDGGDIEVNVIETVELSNTPIQAFVPTGILANSSSGTGQAGDVRISASNLFVDRGAVINNNSGALLLNQPSPGEILPVIGGNAGNIEIDVSNLIELTGISPNGITTSGVSSTAFGGTSSTGDINISTENLVVRDGARIDAATTGSRVGGEITIKARESVIVSGTSPLREPALIDEIPSAIAATSGRIDLPIEATGKAGNLNIETKKLVVQDGARIAVNSFSVGAAGNLNVVAESITLNDEGTINAATVSGQGGNIDLQVDRTIDLQNNSLISAQAANNADGGNIDIETEFIIASPNQNNDITASAEQGTGGNITITAEGVFGLQERSSTPPNNTNDIDASSEFGLDGNVLINTPDVGVFKEVIEAPTFITLQTLGANACSRREETGASSFNITGKGGVPPQPTEPLSDDAIVIEGKAASSNTEQLERVEREQIKPLVTAQGEIYPARGMVFLENGDIELTAYPTSNVQRTPHNSSSCHQS